MKFTVWISIILHVAFFLVLAVLPSRSRSLARTQKVYEVALVSVPQVVEEAPAPPVTREPEPQPVLTPKPKPPEKKEEPVDTTPTPPPVETPTEEVTEDTVQTTPVAGASQVNVDIDNFPFADYLAIIRYRVEKSWRPPIQNLDAGSTLSAIVGFRIQRNGRIGNIQLESSSGRFMFNRAAQQAIHGIGRLPPLPDDFTGETLTVHIEFESVW